MTGYIQRIETIIPNSHKKVSIDVQGRNLIFTGGNGCGKTQLLNALYNDLTERVVNRRNPDVVQLEQQINNRQSRLKTMSKADSQYHSFINAIESWTTQLEAAKNPPIAFSDIEKLVVRYHDQKALMLKFDANRQADIRASSSVVSMEKLKGQVQGSNRTSSLFEEYLVSHKTAQAYAEAPSIDNDQKEAKRINSWFEKLQNDLRELFEDQSLNFEFDSKVQTFFIKQENKHPYRLQQLSSGFSSILSVYADLLTKVELRSIDPEEVDGVVFIDEIDAHLHVSLQRKILSFLDKSFPKVQFIVATHSPFVVSSVDDAVIYDLSRLEQVDDLSLYSYESILEGLFNVLPISEVLKDKVMMMSEILNSQDQDFEKLKSLVSEISEHESKLDSESALFLSKAKMMLHKSSM